MLKLKNNVMYFVVVSLTPTKNLKQYLIPRKSQGGCKWQVFLDYIL